MVSMPAGDFCGFESKCRMIFFSVVFQDWFRELGTRCAMV